MIEEKTDEQVERKSISEIIKENTSEVLQKIEQQVPMIFQNYSNLYTQYIHMLDDVFGTCFISEKKLFGNMNTNPNILKQIQENSKSTKETYIQNIENSSKFFEEYSKMKIKFMKSFNNYVHDVMTVYFNILSQFKKPNMVKI